MVFARHTNKGVTMNANELYAMINGQMNANPGDQMASTATASINKLTGKRVRDLMSRFSNTNMARSGISGVAANDMYSNAGESIGKVNAEAEQMNMQNRSNMISKLLGLYQYEDQAKRSETDWTDVLGYGAGTLLGSTLGPVGAAIGGKIGGLIK